MSKKPYFKLTLCLLAALLLACVPALALRARLEQRRLAAGLIRLHVTANSDAAADQAKKLEVRDAVLPVIGRLTEDCASAGEAEQRLLAGFPVLEAAARGVLGPEDGGVRLSLGEEIFPRRDYPTFSLPAGPYRALRVVIGEGRGHNWWCVAFPALCIPADGDDFSDAARAAGLEEDQVEFMRAETPAVRLRFRLLDWLSALFD